MKVIIKNIAELIFVEDQIQEKVSGSSMEKLSTIKDAFLYGKWNNYRLWTYGKLERN